MFEERKKREEREERDYPEVQFGLSGYEGKSEEEIQRKIEEIEKKRDLILEMQKMGFFDEGKNEYNNNSEHPRRTR